MRLLFAFVGGFGHLEPLLHVARAAKLAGHPVQFACAPAMRAVVERAGFEVFVLGPKANKKSPARLPLRPVDREREERELRERFVRLAARQRAPLAARLLEALKPDLVVCDEADFGTMIAAELARIPHASVQVIAAGSFIRPDVVRDALGEVRAELGLPADPGLEMLHRYLVLSPFPPSFRHPRFPPERTVHPIRPGVAPTASDRERAPRPSSGRSTVYCTLGTIFNSESGGLLATLVEGLRDLDRSLVVTVGHEIDPNELGPQPPHVHVEQFVPQSEILPHCELVVCHGGSGSVMGALSHGLPSVLVPLGADQPENGDRCRELGVARVLDAADVTPVVAHDAAVEVLEDPGYRRAAERLRDEIRSLPDASHAVLLLEQLARDGVPLARGGPL